MTREGKRSREAAITWRMRLARVPAVVVTCGMIVAFGWGIAANWATPMERCMDRYANARTAADTARIDDLFNTPRWWKPCGRMRRDGTLDRHARALERRRAADPAAAGPLMEK